MVKNYSDTGGGKKNHYSDDSDVMLFRTLFEAVPMLFWLKDTRNNIIKISKDAARLYGKNAGKVEGKPLGAFFEKKLTDQSWKQDKEVIRSKKPILNIIH